MKIDFIKVGNKYEATFQAESDFNVHIEKEEKSSINFYQKSIAGGQYDSINMPNINHLDNIFDCDFVAVVYPKWIKIVCEVEPTVAEVNFSE